MVASACTNPTVDPSSTFTAKGVVVDRTGAPLKDAEVRLIKYSSDFNIFQPSVETLFSEDPSNHPNRDILDVSVVATGRTNAEGEYTFDVLGEDIAKPGGVMTSLGMVEVADVVVVARDPMDASDKSGVYTYNFLFQQAAKVWDAGQLPLWDSSAEADVSTALTSGLVKFSWAKLERSSTTQVRNAYRVWVEPATEPGPRLIIYCNQGEEVEGGCAQDPADANKLTRYLSAYSIALYYSDNDGTFSAFIQGNSPDYRFVSRFVVTNPIPDIPRTELDVQVFAVNTTSRMVQDLTNTAATDGAPGTRERITVAGANAIYAKLVQNGAAPVISDAGILNSLIKNAAEGCLVLEFTVNVASDVNAALDVTQWERKGKFCGENGARDEMSALASLDTSAQDGVAAAWMRLTVEGPLTYEEVGEVAVFQKMQ
jgi:hypothetical protein